MPFRHPGLSHLHHMMAPLSVAAEAAFRNRALLEHVAGTLTTPATASFVAAPAAEQGRTNQHPPLRPHRHQQLRLLWGPSRSSTSPDIRGGPYRSKDGPRHAKVSPAPASDRSTTLARGLRFGCLPMANFSSFDRLGEGVFGPKPAREFERTSCTFTFELEVPQGALFNKVQIGTRGHYCFPTAEIATNGAPSAPHASSFLEQVACQSVRGNVRTPHRPNWRAVAAYGAIMLTPGWPECELRTQMLARRRRSPMRLPRIALARGR